MAVKYECSKCQRRFIDWAIDKIKEGTTCEECTGEHLIRVGAPIEVETAKAPSLKRNAKKVAAPKADTDAPVEDAPAVDTEDDILPDAEGGEETVQENNLLEDS